MNEKDTFLLWQILANSGDNCVGSGLAILCNLIRTSKNRNGEFSPLNFIPPANKPELRKYYEQFGCKEPSSVLGTMLGVPTGDMPRLSGQSPLVCFDRAPQQCAAFLATVVEAENYFGDINNVGLEPSQSKTEPGSPAQAEENPQSLSEPQQLSQNTGFGIPATALVCFFVGSGISFVLFRSRHDILITGEEPLLTA
jgi:hypothetical protein